MPRPRTATKILEARGAFKKNPNRKRDHEPQSGLAFPKRPPSRLTPEQRAAWREVVRIAPGGVLTGADTVTVEIVAVLLAEFRADSRAFPTNRLARLTSEMGKIGLSPSARAGLEIHKPEFNEFDDL
jgi:phage terminase small subunit